MIDDKELQEHWEVLNECDASRPLRPLQADQSGGLEPTQKQLKIFKKVDLITLPASIEGTHCFNCEYIEDKKGGIGWCKHEKIHQWVTQRMCCREWSHEQVQRAWTK